MAPRVTVDHDLCVGSGACILEAPEAFAFPEGSQSQAIVLPGAADLSADRLSEIADLCPMDAIVVEG